MDQSDCRYQSGQWGRPTHMGGGKHTTFPDFNTRGVPHPHNMCLIKTKEQHSRIQICQRCGFMHHGHKRRGQPGSYKNARLNQYVGGAAPGNWRRTCPRKMILVLHPYLGPREMALCKNSKYTRQEFPTHQDTPIIPIGSTTNPWGTTSTRWEQCR